MAGLVRELTDSYKSRWNFVDEHFWGVIPVDGKVKVGSLGSLLGLDSTIVLVKREEVCGTKGWFVTGSIILPVYGSL